MRLLLILPSVPHPGNRLAGAPNVRSGQILTELCDIVLTVSPRPWAPRALRFHPRWRTYSEIPARCSFDGLEVHRPGVPAVPFLGGTGLIDFIRTHSLRRFLAAQAPRQGFDVILSFDLLGCGGVAWRLGRHLGIPAAGWAVGSDVRVPASSARGRLLAHTIRNLDLVFYQSEELQSIGQKLVGADDGCPSKHKVRSRGIIVPDSLPGSDARQAVRGRLGFGDEERMTLYVGRMAKDKGIFDLVRALQATVAARRPRLVLLGSVPAYDETEDLLVAIRESGLSDRDVVVLPACQPEDVWQYYAASDMYAFPSFREGMPNSVLEAMAAGLPVVAFDIPAIQSINSQGPVIATAPVRDFSGFVSRLQGFADDARGRAETGERAREVVKRRYDMRNTMRTALEDLQELTWSGRAAVLGT